MLVLIVLFATWCSKCHMMLPIVDEFEEANKGLWIVKKIDVEKRPEEMKRYEAKLVPTFIVKREDEELGRMAGLIEQDTFVLRLQGMARRKK